MSSYRLTFREMIGSGLLLVVLFCVTWSFSSLTISLIFTFAALSASIIAVYCYHAIWKDVDSDFTSEDDSND